jgi:predicted permease
MVATGALFGLAPAIGAGRVGVSGSLKGTSRGSTAAGGFGAGRLNLRFVLVAAELALSFVLLVGAGLLVRSFARLQNVAPGFDRRGVLTFEVMMAGRQYAGAEAVRSAYRRLWAELDRLPGVSASGGVTALPLSGFFAWGPITIEGRTPPAGEQFINADQRTVSGRYFEAMGIPLRRGRLFAETDTAAAPRVAIIDERMAQEFWPGQDPIGRRLRNGDARSTSPWITVVGVVGRVKQYALDADSRIAFYTPQSQTVGRSLYVVVKHHADAAGLTSAVTRAVHSVDPDLPLYRIRTLDDVVQRSLSVQRFATWLLTAFAATALALALVGIYGVMSYLVSKSARDLGIRMALGATRGMILTWVLRHAAAVTAVGAAIGLAAAALTTRVLRGLIFGIDTTDAVAFAAVTVLLVGAALVASYIPARRATLIDPLASIHENG